MQEKGRILYRTVKMVGKLEREAMEEAKQRLDSLTKPPGSLGVLEDLVIQLAGITGKCMPRITRKVNIVMAADHGVVAEGVSAFPQEVTKQMVMNFINGGAAINVLSRHVGAEVTVVDIGVAGELNHPSLIGRKVKYGTDNMAIGSAMSREEAVRAIEVGIEVVNSEIDQGADLIATGDMGIGNTTSSSAILAVYSDEPLENLVGPGTGLKEEKLKAKVKIIEKALAVNKPDPKDALDVLAKVGGLEIAGLAGCIIGAAARRVPVVIDGFIAGAAALIASGITSDVKNYVIASHVSAEPGHRVMVEHLGVCPMLHMRMRLGEGTGAVLAMNLIEAATKIMAEMATFEDAGVSQA